jgi:cell wall-associated NlpC family hydrolase
MLVGVLLTAGAGAFADEVNKSPQTDAGLISAADQPQSTLFSAVPSSDPESAAQPLTDGGRAKSFLSGMAGKAGDVVAGALNMIGVRYRWGGNSPDSGLDCSGFVRYVFQDTLGLELPRRAVEMSRVGQKVRFSDLKPGDLVFFDTVRRTISHVGIYIGDNKFVHSPSTGSTIRVDDLDDSYWEKRFKGARRVETHFPDNPEELRQRVSATVDVSAGN